MTQAAIQQLIADGIVVALEAQAATMANTNRNVISNYKGFMSCQPSYFNGTEGSVALTSASCSKSSTNEVCLVSVNTARQVNAAYSKTTVNVARPMSYLSKTAHSTVKRPINNNTAFKNSNINQRVNTVRGKNVNTARPKAVVNVVQGNNVNAVKASACWVWKPKTKVLDHVSKHNSASITLKKFDYIDA
ncbi:hypothetical protein Tco_0888643 [Tanacetum coccineum]